MVEIIGVRDVADLFRRELVPLHLSDLLEGEEEKRKFYQWIIEEARKRGWIEKDEQGEEKFIWEDEIVCNLGICRGRIIPQTPEDAELIEMAREFLFKIKERGAEDIFEIMTMGDMSVEIYEACIYIGAELASKVLEREVSPGEELTFEEVTVAVIRIAEEVEGLIKEAKERGWIGEDGNFIWWSFLAMFSLGEDPERPVCPQAFKVLQYLREKLREVKRKGAEEFLLIIGSSREEEVIWSNDVLFLPKRILRAGKKEATIDDAIEIFDSLHRKWRKIVEPARKKGWTWSDKYHVEYFIWQHHYVVKLDEHNISVPSSLENYKELKRIRKWMYELKKRGAERYLKVKKEKADTIQWRNDEILISNLIVDRALGQKREELSFDDAVKCIDWLWKKWFAFMKEAKRKGWICLGENGKKEFIWRRFFEELYMETVKKERKRVEEIERWLLELREKGAERFLKIRVKRRSNSTEVLSWFYDEINVNADTASKALKRKLHDGDPLSVEEVLRVLEYVASHA